MFKITEKIKTIFAEMNTDAEAMTNLMVDSACGREMFDAETNTIISKAVANQKIREFSNKILGISDIHNMKEVRRAIRDNGRELLDVMEDAVVEVINYGQDTSTWFNMLVEEKRIGIDDEQRFYTEKDSILAVCEAGDDHYSHTMQRLGGRTYFSVPVSNFVVKIGMDIQRYVTGQDDWTKFVTAVAKAYMTKEQEMIFAEVSNATSVLPINDTRFVVTGTLTKTALDNIIANVADANGVAITDVVIMGASQALKALKSIVDVDYISDTQKENVTNTGIIGIYDGSKLVEIANRFTDETLSARILPTNELYIFANVAGDKMIKLIRQGEVTIEEAEQPDKYNAPLKSYEIHEKLGIGTVFTRYFGKYTM